MAQSRDRLLDAARDLVAEGGFALGIRTELRTAIEEKVGPTRIRGASDGSG